METEETNVVKLKRREKCPMCGSHRWISVDERLPEEDCQVLVTVKCLSDGDLLVDTAWLIGGKWIDENGDEYDEWGVTHWQPLPEPAGDSDTEVDDE